MSLTAAVSNFSNFPFTPLQLPGCIVWFDSADSNTYSGSGTTGFQWRSKGLNPLTASVNQTPGPAAATCNGYPCIYFSNSNTKLLTGTIPTLGAAGTTWFAAGFNNCNPQPADAAVLIASVSPEKAIRWSIAGNVLIYALDASPLGTQTASNNGVRGFIETTSLFSAYQNGTLSSNTTVATYQGGTNVSFVMGQWATSGLIGGINEVIVYNSPLSITQYQQVEGYLAWKYGYNAQLPATHPNFRAAPPVAGQPTNFGQTVNQTVTRLEPLTQQNTSFWRAFSPTGLPNCVGWFDGKDPLGTGAVPTDGAAVSTWVDKSGQANNAITVGSNPTYSSNGFVIFNGANTLKFTDPNALVASNTLSIFVVEQRSNPQNTVNFTYWLGGSAGSANTNLQFGYRASNTVTLGFFANDYNFGVALPTANEPFRVWGGIWDGTSKYIYLNGAGGSATATGNVTSWANGSIGFYGSASTFYTGNIGEIIFFKPALNATNRQQVEGYLAYKWGLQSNLPATHPVASNQSAILFSNVVIPLSKTIVMSGTNRWQPNAVTGLALWLDAADAATVQFSSGANVSNWMDKSGNGWNAVPSSGSGGTYTPRSINGLATIGMTIAGNMYAPVPAQTFTNQLSAFVVFMKTGTNTKDTVIHRSPGVNTDVTCSPFLSYTGTRVIGNGSVAAFTTGATNPFSNVVPTLYNFNISSNANTTWNEWINGSGFTYTLSGGTPGYGDTSTRVWLGAGTNVANPTMAGVIAEVIMYNTTPTTAQRQLTEGYLAWKWGLRGSLPANHPYKIIPPS